MQTKTVPPPCSTLSYENDDSKSAAANRGMHAMSMLVDRYYQQYVQAGWIKGPEASGDSKLTS